MTISKAKMMLLAAPMALAVSMPAMAQETTVTKNPDGTKTVTEVIGYEETVTYNVPEKDAIFARMDQDNDGVLTWIEFRNNVRADNAYSLFLKMDENGDKVVDINEYRRFDRFRNRVLTESDGDNRVAVDRQFTSTNIPAGEARTETRFVPTKTQNFGTRN